MHNIHADTLAQLRAVESRPFLLVDKVIAAEHYRWTDCDVPIPAHGGLYEPRRFQLGDIRFSKNYLIDSCSLSVDNLDELLTSLYGGSTPRGSATTVYHVSVDAHAHVIGEPIILFPGKVDDWILDDSGLTETLRSRTGRGDVCTLLRHTPSCPWEFKGPHCGYAGAQAWCDRSYACCSTLGNTDNFGGFRWLASLATKEIWWGRTKA